MPTLQLLADGKDAARILALMHFPTAEDKREDLFTWLTADEGTDGADQPTAPSGRVLLRMSDVGWRGTVAGEMLLRIAAMAEFDIEEPSVRKAVYSWGRHALALRTREDGTLADEPTDNAIGLTERASRKCLSDFKPVVHFWAAHRVLERDTPFYNVLATLTAAEEMQRFLAHATWFLDFGSNLRSRNYHDGPLLDPAGIWTVIPAQGAQKPDFEPERDALLSELADYKATKSL